MLVTIDVGNTELKIGCFEGGELSVHWRLTTEQRRTADEYGVLFQQLFASTPLKKEHVSSVVIGSVVPKLDPVLREAAERYFEVSPNFFRPGAQSLMRIETKRPGEVGADLVAAAIGARERYGRPLIVIHYGTATTFAAVSPLGSYLGVAIAPGMQISIDALVERTAQLPQVRLETPRHAIGRDTIAALQSGIVYGFVAQTEGMVRRIKSELGVPAKVIATGGLAEWIVPYTEAIDAHDPHLILHGLQLYHRLELSQKRSEASAR